MYSLCPLLHISFNPSHVHCTAGKCVDRMLVRITFSKLSGYEISAYIPTLFLHSWTNLLTIGCDWASESALVCLYMYIHVCALFIGMLWMCTVCLAIETMCKFLCVWYVCGLYTCDHRQFEYSQWWICTCMYVSYAITQEPSACTDMAEMTLH